MSILEKVKQKTIFKRYVLLIFAELISAVNFNLLLKPVNLVAGGTSGLSLVIEEMFHIDTTTFIIIMYIITFVLSLLLLGKESIMGLLFASVFYPLFVSLTSNITNVISVDYTDLLLIALFGGLNSGISNGIIYKNGFPSSGIGIIGPILNKYFHVSIAKANLIINAIIVFMGGYYFGVNMVLYAIIVIYISSYVNDIIILGNSYNKALILKSNKIDIINKYIKKTYKVEPTMISSHGLIEKNEYDFELIVIPTIKYPKLKKEILNIDSDCFFVTSNCYEYKRKTSN